jgi:hypothetical protein
MEQSDLALTHTDDDSAFRSTVRICRTTRPRRTGASSTAIYLAPRIYLSSRSVLSLGSVLDPVSRTV